MSSADLYEDGFPHGTKEGYDRGCRGSACPGALEFDITCAQAKARYNGDYGYRKRVDAGMTPAQIRAEEPAKPAAPAAAAPKPIARPKPPAPTPVPAELQQWPDETESAADETQPAVDETSTAPRETEATASEPLVVYSTSGKVIPLEQHGTPRGYWAGCRDDNCPGVQRVGKTCRKAISDYQAEKKRARREDAKAAELAAPKIEDHADAFAAAVDAAVAAATPTAELSVDEQVKVEALGLDSAPDADLADADEMSIFGVDVGELGSFDPAAWDLSAYEDAPGVPEPREVSPEFLGTLHDETSEPLEDSLRRALWESEARNRELLVQLREVEESREVETRRVVVPAGRSVTISIVVGV